MFRQFFQDRWGEGSAKRFAGILGMGAFIGMGAASGLGFHYSETLVLGGVGICAGLLGSTLGERGANQPNKNTETNDVQRLP